jgi:cytochrome c
MSSMWFNMAAGAILATGLGIMGLRTLGDMIYSTDTAAVGFPVEVAEEGAGGGAAAAGPELKPDWGTLFADPAKLAEFTAAGDKAHKVCTSCHSDEPGGANKTGPALYGVFGRTAGTHPGFNYSAAMKAYGQPWSYDGLYEFLKNPKGYVEGTSMSFAGVKKSEDRIALVAYLRSIAPAPAALPAPDPTRDPAQVAAAAAAAPATDGAVVPTENGAVPTTAAEGGAAVPAAEPTAGQNAPAPTAAPAPAAAPK